MTAFASLKIVGGLLPSDLLDRVFAGDPQVPGTSPATYGLERGESVRRQASRSWLYLLEVWQEFQRRLACADDGLGAADARSARVTRERWLHILLRELGFRQVTADGGFEIDGKSFPVSHRAGHVPIHLLGWDTDLDHKTPKVTARAPQSMLQELLNRDDSCLWAILSNGTALRILRDSTALVGSSYVEFDLQAIFDGELFSDFVLLYLVCHESRSASVGDGGPETCYLEQWRGFAAEQGERALDQLRGGVQQAIAILGTGFLSHPDNPQLRIRLDPRNAELKLDDVNRALLRVVYRMLFWFVAEDRDALLIPDSEGQDAGSRARLREARDRYIAYFSSARLRQLARRHRGGRHPDLWEAVQLVFDGLAAEGGIPELALPGFGGIFEAKRHDGQALPLDEPLTGARLSNEALLGAIRALSVIRSRSGGGMRRVDFGNLGAEELGSVYESLLELIPHYDAEQRSYTLDTLPGNERKETGSYYTPTSLVECLLDSALDPLLDEACKASTPEERVTALLDITVCDPACGSGHFLVAAARRIAKRIASEETGEPEPPEAVIRAALRRVAGRCIYGVDVNPMAAELAKVSLWLEALEPSKPLSFLDQNIRLGNSLLGVTPALLEAGLPDAALTAIEGDDRKVAAALKKQNATERSGQHDLFSPSGIPVSNAALAKRADQITHTLPDSLEDLHIHQQRQASELAASAELRQQKLLADAWCAAFVQPKTADNRTTAITQATLESFAASTATLESAAAEELVASLTRQYRFFHWHVEFPHIFRVGNGARGVDAQTGWAGGFSCVIGNPPWERVKLQEQEFFAARSPKIANAPNAAARKKLIADLPESDSPADQALFEDFQAELRKASGWSHLLRDSARYPLTGKGDVNTYAVFAETARTIIGPPGRLGIIVPTGIATDHTTSSFFGDIVGREQLDSLLDFVTNPRLWTDVGHRRYRFSILVVTGAATSSKYAEFSTLIKHPAELPLRGRRIRVPASDLLLVNPNTGTCPMFRTQRDAEITVAIYKQVPVLWRDDPEDNPWGLSFMAMYHMANDSNLFWTREQLESNGWMADGNVFVRDGRRMLPLYEAKLIYYFDHRLSCYSKRPEGSLDTELPRLDLDEKNDPYRFVTPRYWVQEFDTLDEQRSKPGKPVYHPGVASRLKTRHWGHGWLLGWRDITNATNERTVVAGAIPRAAVGDKFLLAFTSHDAPLLQANLSAFVLDYAARQKFAGTSFKYYLMKQLPVLPPTTYEDPVAWLGNAPSGWIRSRVLELSYTAWDMEPFAEDLGDEGPPFRWDEARRFVMLAELDAAYFHLYGIVRDDVDYVMETFSIVKRKDVERYGSFRTKDLILQVYDAMAEVARTEVAYQTILDSPPGKGLGIRHADVRGADVGRGDRSTGIASANDHGDPARHWGKLPPVEVFKELGHRIQLNPHELSLDNSGLPRYERALGWQAMGAVTVGWMSKMGGWSITEAGIEALETYPTADRLLAEVELRYREVDQRRKNAQQSLSEVQQFIATALLLVEPGRWTAHDDLAALAGTTGNEVAHFLASVSIKLANAYRVLNQDGSIPPEGMLNAAYRGTDLRRRLTEEGLNFDSGGRASQEQQLTADALRELLDARARDDLAAVPATRRAWMVRGSNVEGYNLVEEWLRDGFVSLSASQLAHLSPDVSYDELKRAVEASYQHKSYAYRAQRLEEVDRFLRRMRVGDLALTSLQGEVYLGEVSGRAWFADSNASHSNLRRDVKWLNLDNPVEISRLRAPVPALLQSQAYVVDLTEAYEQFADLIPRVAVDMPLVAVPEPVKRQLAFNPVTAEFAEDMLMDQKDLAQIVDLLWERKQIILYGPPGTGKTYLATRLARHLTEDGAVKLVQFHPSYTYEDFFEGFRPEPGGSGTLTFELRAGPFRDFAEVATANPSTAYILIIDEINRANLAKVFGELYFLLEYRDESISLQYSPDREFTLPQNLFIIGTMNTADRSIARIDAAMRRRFLFVELDPRIPPVHGLLSRWLDRHGLPQDAALLLDTLNARIEDSDAAIGPSYLMDERIYQRGDGIDRVWKYSIMPLLEDLFYGQDDLVERYGLPSLRRAITGGQAAT